jgi:pimeloyl-ACP methyl ester carboxylesterase
MARTRRAVGRRQVVGTAGSIVIALMPEVTEHSDLLGDQPLFWREAEGDEPPVLYLHGAPTSSDDWVPFLQRTGGLAPDLFGFGRSSKRGDLDFTMAGYDRFVEVFLDHVGVDRVRLVAHDWGVVGLLLAQRHPERIERLVLINAVPLLPGYRWHRVARLWRTPAVGEVAVGLSTRWAARRAGVPETVIEESWPHFDQGTQRAILRLYRSSPEDALARAGLDLGRVDCPALVVWGDVDPYIAPHFAEAYAGALGGETEVWHLTDAGHWPWHDRTDVIDRIAAFLDS